MKRRILAWATAAALCLNMFVLGAAAAENTETVVVTAEKSGQQLLVTVSARSVTFNVLQLYIAYDQTRLTPSAVAGNEPTHDAGEMTEYLQPEFDAIFAPEGWMQGSAALDEKNGVARHLVMADLAAAGQGILDETGFYTAVDAGTALWQMSFQIKEGATLYLDSVKLGKSAGAPNGVAIATKDAAGIEAAETVKIDLSAVAENSLTPGGTREGYFGKPEETPPTGGGNSGSSSGGSSSGSGITGSESGAKENSFTDIANHWARTEIEELAKAGVVNGSPDGRFLPDDLLTRAEFAAVLVRVMGLTADSGENVFADCAGHWATKYINAVNKAGYMTGVGNNSFAPGRYITREELVTSVARVKSLSGGDTSVFTDSALISPWARDSVAAAAGAGVIKGYPDGSFGPQNRITRGEMAKMIAQLLG